MAVSVAYNKILDAINKGRVLNKYEAAQLVPCHHRTAQRMLHKLHKQKLLTICAWEPVYHQQMPVYCLKNEKEDAYRPPRITPLEAVRRYRAKPEKKLKEINQKRAKRLIKKVQTYCAQDEIFNLIILRQA